MPRDHNIVFHILIKKYAINSQSRRLLFKILVTMIIMDSVGHKGVYGHEFLEYEFKNDGRLRYANNSNYKQDVLIRKEGRK